MEEKILEKSYWKNSSFSPDYSKNGLFDEFVIFIKFKSNDDLNTSVIEITDISVSSKAQNIMMSAIDEGESFLEDPEDSDKENFTNLGEEGEKIGMILRPAEFIQTCLNDLDIFIDVLVEEDEWPKGVLIDEKILMKNLAKLIKTKKMGLCTLLEMMIFIKLVYW